MYIRRKVFSVLVDEAGEEKLFSTTEVEIQREFSISKEEEDRLVEKNVSAARTRRGILTGVGATIAAEGGVDASRKIGDKILVGTTRKAINDHLAGKISSKTAAKAMEAAVKIRKGLDSTGGKLAMGTAAGLAAGKAIHSIGKNDDKIIEGKVRRYVAKKNSKK